MPRSLLSALLLLAVVAPVAAQDAPDPVRKAERRSDYRVLVAAESADEVYEVAFDGARARVARVIPVGFQPTEIEGPHGLAVAPDGRHWFVSMAHGKPFGVLGKHDAATGRLVARTELGMFPATMQISRATGLLYCVNFNLHGRMLPSSVSIVDPEAMVEVARTTTGPMPHGSRLSPDGLVHYSCAMMSGHLFEIDAVTFEVRRRLQLDAEEPEGHDSDVKPTWVHVHPDGRRAYVALNGAAQIAEVDLASWRVTHRLPTAAGPYNLEVAPDGKKLVATCKTAGEIGIWDLEERVERARLPSTRKVTHGVVITPDGRYAFVTSEGIGAETGALDVLDLTGEVRVASVEVGLQAGGVAILKAPSPVGR